MSVERKTAALRKLAALAAEVKQPCEIGWLDRARTGPLRLAVVGEFNTGKSTLINALIGEALLPTNVKPTTSVPTSISYGEKREAIVHYLTGKTESVPITAKALNELVAREEKADEISIVRITLPGVPKGIEIIDTPGTNDLSQLRLSALYGILPTADAVLMVTRATAALRAAEISFLRDRLLGQDLTRVLFVVNQMDLLEAQDREELMPYCRETLSGVLGKTAAEYEQSGCPDLAAAIREAAANLPILPLSAMGALKARREEDAGAIKASGLAMLQEFIDLLARENAKETLLEQRIASAGQRLAGDIARQLGRLEQLQSLSKEQLAEQIKAAGLATEQRLQQVRVAAATAVKLSAALDRSIEKECDTFFGRLEQQLAPGSLDKPAPAATEKALHRFVEGQAEQTGLKFQALVQEVMQQAKLDPAALTTPDQPPEKAKGAGKRLPPVPTERLNRILETLLWIFPFLRGLRVSREAGARIHAQIKQARDAVAASVKATVAPSQERLRQDLLAYLDEPVTNLRHLLAAYATGSSTSDLAALRQRLQALSSELEGK